MFRWPRFEVLGIPKRDFALVFALLFNVFTWSYMIITAIGSIPVDPVIRSSFSAVFYIGAAGASLSGGLLAERMKRLRLLYFWTILGTLSSFLLVLVNSVTIGYLSIIFIFLGISFGLGMPSSFAYLADNSTVENRARISSLILLVANLGTFPVAILFSTLGAAVNAVFLTVWRGLGLAVLLLMKPREPGHSDRQKRASFASVLTDRPFFLYLLPWTMFCLIDTLEKSLLINFINPDLQALMLIVEPLVAVPLMLISGLLADRIGRKRVVIYGFISLGIGYAVLGLAPTMKEAWYLYFVVDGIAWGIFYTILLLTVWGDLSNHYTREKYYAVATFPFVIRSTFPLFLTPVVSSVSANAAFSLASFFLFLAVLPLMYAPETLPEKKIELRRLKSYIEQAKKLTRKAP